MDCVVGSSICSAMTVWTWVYWVTSAAWLACWLGDSLRWALSRWVMNGVTPLGAASTNENTGASICSISTVWVSKYWSTLLAWLTCWLGDSPRWALSRWTMKGLSMASAIIVLVQLVPDAELEPPDIPGIGC